MSVTGCLFQCDSVVSLLMTVKKSCANCLRDGLSTTQDDHMAASGSSPLRLVSSSNVTAV